MSYLDIGIVSIFLFSVGMGFYRGFVWEIMKYIAFAISIFATVFLLFKLYPIFEKNTQMMWWMIGAGISGFFVSLGLTLSIVHKLSKMIQKTHFSHTDRILGSVFGGVKSVIFVALLHFTLMLVTVNNQPSWLKDSVFLGALDYSNNLILKTVSTFAPQKIQSVLKIDQITQVAKKLEII